jgi:hypothetical protein
MRLLVLFTIAHIISCLICNRGDLDTFSGTYQQLLEPPKGQALLILDPSTVLNLLL